MSNLERAVQGFYEPPQQHDFVECEDCNGAGNDCETCDGEGYLDPESLICSACNSYSCTCDYDTDRLMGN